MVKHDVQKCVFTTTCIDKVYTINKYFYMHELNAVQNRY